MPPLTTTCHHSFSSLSLSGRWEGQTFIDSSAPAYMPALYYLHTPSLKQEKVTVGGDSEQW